MNWLISNWDLGQVFEIAVLYGLGAIDFEVAADWGKLESSCEMDVVVSDAQMGSLSLNCYIGWKIAQRES